jgi:hypothetical protein
MSPESFSAFVVCAEPQPWPYYAEIPYAAWPSDTLVYDSYGNCHPCYSRTWSYLTVMHDTADELLLILDAAAWQDAALQQPLWTQRGRLSLLSICTVPRPYCITGNVVIAAPHTTTKLALARTVHLFVERLSAHMIVDLATQQVLPSNMVIATAHDAEDARVSMQSADAVRRSFQRGEAWHKADASDPDAGFWWKTPMDVRVHLRREARDP